MTAATRQFQVDELAEAQAEVAFLEVLYERLRDGLETWAAWDESLVSGASYDRQDVAVEECGLALDAARGRLEVLRGETR